MPQKICHKKKCMISLVCMVMLLFSTHIVRAESYGDDAYAFMQQLQTNYPQRAVAYPNLDGAKEWLKQTISYMGYQCAEQAFSVTSGENVINGTNLIFSKQGNSNRVILVGAHYDSVLTNGTDDNATGVGVVLEAANRMSAAANLPYTIRFVLFSAEEPGCFGSQYYVDNLSQEERARILCMINVDTIGAGDFCYLYGGDTNDGYVARTWAVEQALNAAKTLGLDMSYHPDVNSDFPVPTKQTASDQQAFARIGIPYIYFEASNWNGGNYTNFYQTSNPAVENGKMMHVPAYENLDFYKQTFGTRIYDHLKAYSELLDYLLRNMVPDSDGIYSYEACDELVEAISSVRIRKGSSTGSDILGVLEVGETIQRIGYHDTWSKVTNGDITGYIKTEYLTVADLEEETVVQESLLEEPSSVAEESEEVLSSEMESEEALSEKGSEEMIIQVEITMAAKETIAANIAENTENDVIVVGGADTPQLQVNQAELKPVQKKSILELLMQEMNENEYLRYGMIGAIALLALLLCILVFLFQNRKKK